MVARQRDAFPDFHLCTREAFAPGDRVIQRMHWTGTHQGDYQSLIGLLPATGQSFAIDGIEIYRITAERSRRVGRRETWSRCSSPSARSQHAGDAA